MNSETVSVIAQKTPWPAALLGSVASLLTADLWFALIGMMAALLSSLYGMYCRRAEDKRAIERHRAWMERLASLRSVEEVMRLGDPQGAKP